jgi:methylthioadenosine phosphorylase (EC 2.4.2.28)
MEPHDGIYVCTEGPHLETPAQIGMIRNFGDVVGMTGYPEVVLARELGLCYATICVVTNVAAGMKKDALTITEVLDQMAESIDRLRDIISHALPKIPEVRSCRCGEALDEAML